ncbi:MAG: helix-turn-helix transcriptional regulator [Firmicutes bacterium]|nr:helix-turn-helix transcriptional regulator [Bacillota bacterium]
MTLGEQIRQARELKRLSQEDLANQLQVSRQTVSKWENDSSVPQGIHKDMLEKVLDISIFWKIKPKKLIVNEINY